MIGAPILLLLGLTGPFEAEDMPAQVAPASRPTPAASGLPQILKKGEKRRRAVRRAQRNDMTETLRAMNLMRVGFSSEPAQGSSRNR
jgi:hypothetical protein